MYIVLALEGVRVLLPVFDTLHLDGCVEQLVLPAAQVGGLTQRLQGFLARDMD